MACAAVDVYDPARDGSRHTLEVVPDAGHSQPGVNLIGYFEAESGVGELARLVAQGLSHARIPFAAYSDRLHPSPQRRGIAPAGFKRVFDVNVVCGTAHGFIGLAGRLKPTLLRGRPTVGCWAWEVNCFPPDMTASLDAVAELWALSEHNAAAMRGATETPVYVCPVPIPEAGPTGRLPVELPAACRFSFLFCFDFFSGLERKNPYSVLAAFRQAFAPGEGPCLLLKTTNGDQFQPVLRDLSAACAERSDIMVIDRSLPRDEQRALVAGCDAYVSLHRAEGFGLTMAEAMSAGKPVIATAYSGNLDFMTEENSFLVPAAIVPIGPGRYPYPAEGHWAEPSVDAAAGMMRLVYENRELARQKAARARKDILRAYTLDATAAFLKTRLDAVAGNAPGAGSARRGIVGMRANWTLTTAPRLSLRLEQWRHEAVRPAKKIVQAVRSRTGRRSA